MIKNPSKHHSNIEVKMGSPLDMDLYSLLHVFRSQDALDIPKMAPQRTEDGFQDVAKTPQGAPRGASNLTLPKGASNLTPPEVHPTSHG